MDEGHSKYHSVNAFCGSAGPEETAHLYELVDKLTNEELKLLVKKVGINFTNGEPEERDAYEGVISEAVREDFYREYRNIVKSRRKK